MKESHKELLFQLGLNAIAVIVGLLFAAWLVSLANAGTITIGKKKAVAGCNPASNEVGDRSQEAGADDVTNGMLLIVAVTADCSGELDTAYLYHANTTNTYGGVALYTKTGASPVVGDTLIKGTAANIEATTSTGWRSGAMTASGNVTATTGYWLVIGSHDSYSSWNIAHGTATEVWYIAADWTGAFPANLNGASSAGSMGPLSAYISIK